MKIFFCFVWLGITLQSTSAQPVFHVLHTFAGGTSGTTPSAAPVEVAPGEFIGAAYSMYRLSAPGDFTVLSTQPFTGALFPASNGDLYGFVTLLEEPQVGICRSDREGTTQVINNFFSAVTPQFEEGRNLSLYGLGEASPNGPTQNVFFQMSLTGTVISYQAGNVANGPLAPHGGPVQGSDGNFYGAIVEDEEYEAQIYSAPPPDGPFTTIYTISGFFGPDGAVPSGFSSR